MGRVIAAVGTAAFMACTLASTGHGGAIRENGERFRAEVLAPGGSRDPRTSVRALLGREPTIEPLLRRRGLD